MAHELGHLKCDHGVWLTFANILTLGAYTIPGLILISLVNVFRLLMLHFIHSLCLIRLNTCVIHRAWWDDCSEVRRTVISLASSSRANL